MRRYLYPLVFLFFSVSGYSQDLHFTQFFSSPLNINPGLTGIFNGDFRAMGNYRSQWRSVPVDYLTFSGAVDFKLKARPSKKGNLNLGFLFNYDKAGDLALNLTKFGISGAYMIKLSQKHIVSPGIILHLNQRRLDFTNAISGNQWNGSGYDPTIPAETLYNTSNSFVELGAGINYRWQKSYRTHVDLGVGFHNLLGSDQSFARDSSAQTIGLDRRLSLHAMGDFKLLSRLNLLGNVLYQKQGPHTELQLNIQGKLFLNKNKDRNVALILGIGMRTQDSWFPMIALQLQNLYVGLSYDSNFSNFDIATDSRGGPEIAVTYRLSKVQNAIHRPCPIY